MSKEAYIDLVENYSNMLDVRFSAENKEFIWATEIPVNFKRGLNTEDCLPSGEDTFDVDSDDADYLSRFVHAPEENKELYTPTNITGFYRKALTSYFKTLNLSSIKIFPARNTDQEKTHKDPFLTIKRGTLGSAGLGIANDGRGISGAVLPAGIPGASGISMGDSRETTHIQTLDIEVIIYGENLAETEKISYLAYKMILAYSLGSMSEFTNGIQYASKPNLTEVLPSKKHSDRFECYLSWQVQFTDDTVLLIQKNMIKYIRITVAEEDSSKIILDNR